MNQKATVSQWKPGTISEANNVFLRAGKNRLCAEVSTR